MKPPSYRAFESAQELDQWLREWHASEQELWVRIFKKASKVPTVSWDDCVIVCLTWGWIDGQRKALDDLSFIQRLTPRRVRSNWSQRNMALAERLLASNTMQPPGLRQVESARRGGRWLKTGQD